MESNILKKQWRKFIVISGVIVFFAILFLRTAWLCDDAYITFRVVDNFVNGYGLRWNVNERVQPYTHPLWMFLHIPFYAITKEMFLTGIFVSFTISMLVIFLVLFFIAENTSQVLIAWSLLGFSRAFVDFSSSGLENPLSHFLLVLFFILFLKGNFSLKKLLLLSLIASLATLNRQDCILIYIPPLIYGWWRTENKWGGLWFLCLGFFPLMIWEIFSIIYYGFPFPNTAYAKLGTGLWKSDLIVQGGWYFLWSWKRDFITILVLILAMFIPFYRWVPEIVASVGGIFLYCLYVLWIGGDFMGGRFLTVPFLLGVILVLRYSQLDKVKWGIPAVLIFLITSLVQPNVPILTDATFGKDLSNFKDAHGIGDERMFYFQVASLSHWERGKEMPSNAFAKQGREYRKQNRKIVKAHGSVGYRGFFGGPKVHIVDYNALADPLLARMPAVIRPTWRIGHFWRYLPEGYLETVANDNNENKIRDENLAQFYEHLRLITRGPVWSFDRWVDIFKMNLGFYNYLIDEDKYKFPNLQRITIEELNKLADNSSANIKVPKYGIEIKFGELKKTDNIKIELDSFDSFQILFFKDANWLARVRIDSKRNTLEPYTTHTISVPLYAKYTGFNAVRVFPYPGDADSSMRRLYLD
ncbi:MAG: hypothetical protein N3G21_06075 [Candidatus Hydrogenedentes bacterium]|nr:hypothetical protein [Candidatus Hydrogenedentota bacterium]